MKNHSENLTTIAFSDIALFLTVGWIVLALLFSPVFRVQWFAPGDFSYRTAMYYHAIMVPVLILLYLVSRKALLLDVVHERAYAVGAILAVLLVGLGSIFNISEGISVATIIQIIGMVMTDILGILLLIALAKWARGERKKARPAGSAFWLLFTSLTAILIAAPLGHLAGACLDLGARSIPGMSAFLNAVGIEPDAFQEGLVASHSHLIVAALMSGLAAVAAMHFQYRARIDWRRRTSEVGLWMVLVSLLLATGIYVVSAIIGWEPPVLFASGPNGIPLDDIILTALEIGFLVLMVGLSGPLVGVRTEDSRATQPGLRASISLNWIVGFLAAVLTGIYIELNEGFYGGGASPAPGALNDNIFIRAHLLYPFLLLPALFAVTLAVGCAYHGALSRWPRCFVWISVIGMLLGLAGEILWFTTQSDTILVVGVFAMVLALTTGMIALCPRVCMKGKNIQEPTRNIQ